MAADLDKTAFHLTAQLGDTTLGAAHFQHLLVNLGKPCPAPPIKPPDYPPLPSPLPDGDSYTCALVEMPSDPPGVIVVGGELVVVVPVPHPLSLDADIRLPAAEVDGAVDTTGGQLLQLEQAGLSNIPKWIQLQMATGDPFIDQERQLGWRPTCRAPAATASCMSPLVRFDQPEFAVHLRRGPVRPGQGLGHAR